jgi:hypothetical protein
MGVHFIGTHPCLRYTPVSEVASGAYLYVRLSKVRAYEVDAAKITEIRPELTLLQS